MAKVILTAIVVLLGANSAFAAPLPAHAFGQWLQELRQEAIAKGINAAVVEDALGSGAVDDRVIELDQKQPESTLTHEKYLQNVLPESRVETGRRLMQENRMVLRSIAKLYGVQPEIIVALWGMESNFGRNTGGFNVIEALITLAYEGRRADFFRKELLNALRILDRERMDASSLSGSWAGAMGQCQFMPSTYLRYAVDHDNDGRADIWNSKKDVFASIANYIVAEGWSDNGTWGREVTLTKSVPESEIGLERRRSLAEWSKMGVRNVNGKALPHKFLQASLVQPDGAGGRSFLVYDNFRALMKWNRSTYFATSVGLLADRIK